MSVAKKLLTLRKKEGLSQEELAEKLNVSRQAISRWEMGSALPDAVNLLQISRLFGVSTDFLLYDEIEQEQELPLIRQAKDSGKSEQNRQTALVILIGCHALALLWGLIGCFVYQNTLVTLLAITMNLLTGLSFEAGYRRYGRGFSSSKEAKRYRAKYYRSCVWLFSYLPVRLILMAVWNVYPRPYSPLVREASILLLYGLLCTAVCMGLSNAAKDSRQASGRGAEQ